MSRKLRRTGDFVRSRKAAKKQQRLTDALQLQIVRARGYHVVRIPSTEHRWRYKVEGHGWTSAVHCTQRAAVEEAYNRPLNYLVGIYEKTRHA